MKKQKIKIRIAIFNEKFWHKGLIFSQNLLPLKMLSNKYRQYSLEIVTFISIYELIRSWVSIFSFLREQRKDNVTFKLFPIFYLPSRLFYPKWYVIPFLLINTFLYIFYLRWVDRLEKSKIYYNLRSYQIALCFSLFYGNFNRLVFDPRTDMLNELASVGTWEKKSISFDLWKFFEKRIVSKSYKTIFISDPMKDDILQRCDLRCDKNKFIVFYNQVDFKHFSKIKKNTNNKFLYTGSLGNWNNIRHYLIFFKKIKSIMKDSILYLVTDSRPAKYKQTIEDPEFDAIRDSIIIYNDPMYEQLPSIYSDCNYGLQIMGTSDSRVGVKFVEYIAAGLIPIVNENVRGAVCFIKNHSIGFVIDNQFNIIDTAFCDKLLKEKDYKHYDLHNLKNLIDVNESYQQLCEVFD